MAKPPTALADGDFQAKWEQKGVDLRIGLDIVTMTESRGAELIVLLTGDTDLIPAMKLRVVVACKSPDSTSPTARSSPS